MKPKILTAVSVILIFLLAVAALLLRHVKPLIPLSYDVVYAETSDFLADGRAYTPLFRRRLLYLHLPGAGYENRWWRVNYREESITPVRRPAYFLFGYVVFQKDFYASPEGGVSKPGMMQKFVAGNISFTYGGLTCIVRKVEGGR